MAHLIRNFEELTTSPLREDALNILESGYAAIDTKKVVRDEVRLEKNTLVIQRHRINLAAYRRIFVVGVGKCAFDAALEIEDILESRITDGLVIDVKGGKLKYLQSHVGTHPFPSEQNASVARSIRDLIQRATYDDLILTIISGGGSALLCLPYQMDCGKLTEVTRDLQRAGATIHETNIVRKHLSEIQGGQFAKLAYPATVVSLIFSDVPGDDLAVIASGPTVLDTTTKEDARKILEKYSIKSDYELTETPKEAKYFKDVKNILVLTNKTALQAISNEARQLGYTPFIYSSNLEGEARRVGKTLVTMHHNPSSCLIAGGETTVTVRGDGIGGRNQEAALGALEVMREGMIFIAASSDGWDNTDAAGALADAALRRRADEIKADPADYLRENNSYLFFEKVKGHIITGRTGENVADFYIVLTGSNYGKTK